MLALGERLHNPFNLERNPSINWQGMVTNSTQKVFCEFTTDLFGIRAGFKDLITKITVDKLDTIEKLITKFAPPFKNGVVENDTEAYIQAIMKSVRKERDEPLALSDLLDLGLGIIQHEQGRVNYVMSTITQGLALAQGKIAIAVMPVFSILGWLRSHFSKSTT